MPGEQKKQALKGLRVLDFGAVGVGPICSMIFGHFGAQVIKVESATHPDDLRTAAPIKPGTNQAGLNASGYFNNFSSNKMSITLDMKNESARQVALDLVRHSDIVVENFKPGVLEKWGLSYEELKAVNRDIIMVRLPMTGSSGPHRDFGGYGRIITPVAGLNYFCGFENRAPVGIGTNYADFVVNPGHGVVGALAAQYYRNRTGEGQVVEVAQTESTAAVIGPTMLDYAVNGNNGKRLGNRHEHAAPHGAFPCKGDERWLALAVFSEEEWVTFCEASANPQWRCDDRFATFSARKANEDELESAISAWTVGQVAEEAMEMLQAAGVAAGVVQNAQDILDNDPHVKAREFYRYLEHPETGLSAYDTPGVRLLDTPADVHSPAPLLGQHNEAVLRDVLGYDDEKITDLLIAGAVQ